MHSLWNKKIELKKLARLGLLHKAEARDSSYQGVAPVSALLFLEIIEPINQVNAFAICYALLMHVPSSLNSKLRPYLRSLITRHQCSSDEA